MERFSHPTARPQLEPKHPPFTSSDADPTETCFLWDFLNALGRHRTTENPVLLSLQGKHPEAILALADGTLWQGQSIGASGTTVGEVVFNTAITGYQEILTDPSYCQQLVTLTYPHIGNYGTSAEDVEAQRVHAAGLIIKDLPLVASNFRSQHDLSTYLIAAGTVAIAGIDTRQLTRHLRTHGAQNGCILGLPAGQAMTHEWRQKAMAAASQPPKPATPSMQ